ncbi:MAG: hypothetical protein R3F19_18420 [Verrucomicrobiales bacterium]
MPHSAHSIRSYPWAWRIDTVVTEHVIKWLGIPTVGKASKSSTTTLLSGSS